MERCGSLRNEDRISELPDALLVQILSLIPTKDAVATSVLSKRWGSLCKMMPNLRFHYRGNGLDRFSDNVCRFLISHKAPVLQSLHLKMSFESESTMDIGVMLGIAFGLHLREFVLQVNSDEPYRFPTSLYNCGGTLETLKLDSVLVDVPFPVCLKSLRTLLLYQASFKDDESVVNLLSGCSILENLEVVGYPHYDVKTFTIDLPSLQSLTIYSESTDDDGTAYVINAPSLKHLKIDGLWEEGMSCLINNMPELVEARITNVSGVIYEKILASLTSVKRLSLEITSPLDPTKFPTGRIFNQLVYLKIHTFEQEWWNLCMLLLHSSPNLQVLKFSSDSYWKEFMRWSQLKYVAECLLNRLETLVWKDYEGEIGDGKEVAKYILRNSCHLKTATFSREDIHPEKRVEWLKELESVVMASNSCRLVFK